MQHSPSDTPPRCAQCDGEVCAQCGGHVHDRLTFHQAGCKLLQREPELFGYESCGCPLYFIGTDDGEPVLVIEHTACMAAMRRMRAQERRRPSRCEP
jgi:hypothetical protein